LFVLFGQFPEKQGRAAQIGSKGGGAKQEMGTVNDIAHPLFGGDS